MAGSGTEHLRKSDNVLLKAEHLTVEFPVGSTGLKVHAVSDISLDVVEGETLGLVGESGCGKSTTGKALMQMPPPTGGEVIFDGIALTSLKGEKLRRTRPSMQMIFQDPISSLNPRRKVGNIIAEPLRVWAGANHPPAGPTRVAGYLWLVLAGLAAVAAALLLLAALANLFGLIDDQFNLLLAGYYVVVAVVFYPLGRLILGRAPFARLVTVGVATVLTASALWAVLDLGDLAGYVALAFWALVLAATVVAFLLPDSRNDFAKMNDLHKAQDDTVREVLDAVGLDPEAAMNRRPHEFSGGQCQRISIARSLVLEPKMLICDEPVSALDVSVQAQVLNLLEDLKERYGLTLLFIAHDLAVVKNVSDRVVVMYLGKLCEVGPPTELYSQPAHPYTGALLSSIPVPDPRVKVREENVLGGEVPSPVAPPSGCRFRTRCPKAQDLCAQVEPKLRRVGMGHFVACHFPLVEADELGPTTA